jgi:MFS family permease
MTARLPPLPASGPEPAPPVARADAAHHDQVGRDLPRNYAANLVHGFLGVTGFRLITAPTFVPAYLYLLSGSSLTVGMALAGQSLGMALSSIWSATLIEHRRRVMPLVFGVGWLMRAQVLGLALSGFLLEGDAALLSVCVFLALFGFFWGMQAVSFNFVIAKVIPANRRGQLAGMRNFLGGLSASALAYLGGKYLVEPNAFGNGYASTFMVAFILTSVGISALSFLREPESLAVRAASSLAQRLRDVPGMLRADRQFTRFFVARALAAFGMAAAPFYAIYAGKFVDLSGAILGYLSLSFLLAQTASNLLWGRIADARGYRLVFLLSVGLWMLSTLGLMFCTSLPMFVLAFCGLGAGLGGYQIASQNFVLEFGAHHELPMLIAVSDTASHLMMAIGPLLGGLLAHRFGFTLVFWIAIAVKAVAIGAIVRMRDPRAGAPGSTALLADPG